MVGAEVEAVALRRLVDGYARAVDRRDPDAFVDLFESDAVLQVFHGPESDGPSMQSNGRSELAAIPARLGRWYAKTFHLVGNHLCDVDGETATGEAYCLAHHFNDGPQGGTDYVMVIRYQDSYRRGQDGVWRFRHRKVMVDWTELRTTLPAAGPARNRRP